MKNNVSVAGKGSEEPQILSAPKMMIESRIKQIRGMQVLLTRDLAELYQVEPRAINQAVKRNKERFPQKYCFQLDSEEFDSLKSQIVISSWGGARIAPYAFTEQGVAMLSAVLKSDRAVRVSIEIMDAFVKMRHYLVENRDILDLKKTDYALLSMQTIQNTSKIADIEHNVGSLSRSVENVHGELQKEFHDRYIVLDYGTDCEKMFHCGASFKDLGKKLFAFAKLSQFTCEEILQKL